METATAGARLTVRDEIVVGACPSRVLRLMRIRFPDAQFDLETREDDGMVIGWFWSKRSDAPTQLAICLEPWNGGWRAMDVTLGDVTLCYGKSLTRCLEALEKDMRASWGAEIVARFLPAMVPPMDPSNPASVIFGNLPDPTEH